MMPSPLAGAQGRAAAVEARETELRREVTRLTERLVAAAEEEARAADAVAALEARGGRECTPVCRRCNGTWSFLPSFFEVSESE